MTLVKVRIILNSREPPCAMMDGAGKGPEVSIILPVQLARTARLSGLGCTWTPHNLPFWGSPIWLLYKSPEKGRLFGVDVGFRLRPLQCPLKECYAN